MSKTIKTKIFFAVLLVLVLVALTLSACIGDRSTSNEITEGERETIAYAYAHKYNMSIENAKAIQYDFYGKFHGNFILIFYVKLSQVISYLEVDGVEYTFGDMNQFEVYHRGHFYTLQEAFDRGWISHDDLLTIKANYEAR